MDDAAWKYAYAFLDNHKFAAETNTQMRNEGSDFRLEINQYADLSFDDFIKVYGGFNAPTQGGVRPTFYASPAFEGDDSIDWRDKNVVNPVQNQGQCGSCWAFSTVGSLESRWAIKSGNLLKLSEQQLVDCDRDQDQGCNGGLMDNAFTYLETAGAETEDEYSYKGVDGTCSYSKSNAKVFPTGFTDVDKTDDALAQALQSGPVSIAVDANIFWQLYFGGILHYTYCSGTELNHGVVLVGATADYWIVRNSWGASWGEQGYIRLERGQNICGI